MRDKDAQLMMEALREAVHPETGQRLSPKQHDKHVQWTKDIKAKLAQAQKIGDSKEANKLQRFLDMHGIDEDNSLDDWNAKMQDEPAGQVPPELDAAAGGDFIGYLNTIKFEEKGAAALVEWLARYNLGAS